MGGVAACRSRQLSLTQSVPTSHAPGEQHPSEDNSDAVARAPLAGRAALRNAGRLSPPRRRRAETPLPTRGWRNGAREVSPNFEEEGYDDLAYLLEVDESGLEEVADDCKIEKKGHRARLFKRLEQLREAAAPPAGPLFD